MNSHSSNETKSNCLSDYQLDCLAFQSADALPESPSMAAHLLVCSNCQGRLHQVRNALPPADLNRLLHAVQAHESEQKQRKVRSVSFLWPQLSFAAAAAAAALFLWPVVKPSMVATDSTSERTKGAELHLNVIRQNASGHVERVISGDVVNAHDSLRFEVESPSDAYVSVVSIDSARSVTAFVPAVGRAVPVQGREVSLLEGAVVLDAVAGSEEIFLVACRAPFVVKEAVQAIATVAPADLQATTLKLSQGMCDLKVVTLKKEVKQ
jgi:predicted metal-binding protein